MTILINRQMANVNWFALQIFHISRKRGNINILFKFSYHLKCKKKKGISFYSCLQAAALVSVSKSRALSILFFQVASGADDTPSNLRCESSQTVPTAVSHCNSSDSALYPVTQHCQLRL